MGIESDVNNTNNAPGKSRLRGILSRIVVMLIMALVVGGCILLLEKEEQKNTESQIDNMIGEQFQEEPTELPTPTVTQPRP